MICKNVYRFCCEDISLIENYDKAVTDTETWDCHHRRETDELLSRKQLRDLNKYYNRPAAELIFLTHSNHQKLHATVKHNMLGKHHTTDAKNKMRIGHLNTHIPKEIRQILSEQQKGRKMMTNGIHRTYVKPEEIQIYLDNGYHFGRK